MSRLGALILFAADMGRTVDFYRAIGLPLEMDDHGPGAGPVHYACDLDGCHFAVFPGEAGGRSFGDRQAGTAFPGFTVESVEQTVAAALAVGAHVLQEPSEYPWGYRAVLEDPDGRPVEVYHASD